MLEVRRNLVRYARDAAIDAESYERCMRQVAADVEEFQLRDLTLDLCTSTLLPALATPRSLDLVHLRTALWFHALGPIDRFVTTDLAQARAARELGLPV